MTIRDDIQAHYGPGSPTLALLLDAFGAEQRAAGVREAAGYARSRSAANWGAATRSPSTVLCTVSDELYARADAIATPPAAPCPQHPTAPVIAGACGGCTQYPTDMRPTAQPPAECVCTFGRIDPACPTGHPETTP